MNMKGRMRQGSLWRVSVGSSDTLLLFKWVWEVTAKRINYICREPHPGGRKNVEEGWGMVWDHLSIFQASGSLCHNSAGSGETRKMGRKSRNRDLKPGQNHSNVSRDSESWAQILIGKGNLGRKHLFSKNNNKRASILWGTLIHVQKEGGKAWPLAPRSLGRFEMVVFSFLLITKVAFLDCGQCLCLFLIHFHMYEWLPTFLTSHIHLHSKCCLQQSQGQGWTRGSNQVYSYQWNNFNPATKLRRSDMPGMGGNHFYSIWQSFCRYY